MANKKINQLVSKTSILSTDLFGIGDATTGQLYKKTIAELQAAIGGAVISVNGLVGTVVLDTDDIQELVSPTNKWFTDARARGAISLTVTGSSGASTYNSGTGVLNVPTYTLAGLGGISATFLSGGTGISYNSGTGVISYSGTVYTDSSIRGLISAGTGISYNSTTGAISYSGTVYTDSSVRALLSLTTTGSSGASTYNSTTGVINVPNYTLAGLGGISLTSLSGGAGITYNSSTGEISYSGTVYTDASVRALLSAGTGISYNSTTGVIASTITQYTDALARASISITTTGTSGASTYNSTTGVINVPQYQGAITLTTTGTSGAATFSSNTLNIPNYGSALSGYLPLTGGTLTGSLAGTTASFSGNGNFGSQSLQSWGSIFRAIQIGVSCSIVSATSSGETDIALYSNTYYDGTNYKILNSTTQVPSYFQLADGTLSLATGNTGSVGSNVTSLTTKFVVTKTGNVGIGTSSPGTKLQVEGTILIPSDVSGTSGYKINYTTADGGSRSWKIGNDNHAYGDFYIGQSTTQSGSSYSTKFLIHPSGNVSINTTSDNGYKLYVAGTIYATGNITANSDLTLKKNLELITNPTDKLMQLNGYSYQWKSDDSHQYGVIAQEVEKILPYAVSTGNDGIKGVSYNQIIPVLIEAVKEQKKELEELRDILASK
jgi:hypothetical protein